MEQRRMEALRILVGQVIREQRREALPARREPQERRGVVRLADFLIEEAIACGASDMHLEPQEDCLRLRYRRDGMLEEIGRLPLSLVPPLLSRFKVMAGMDIAQQQRPQDGHIHYRHGVDLRVSSLPTARGEVLVLRLLLDRQEGLELAHLGFSDAHLQLVQKLIHRPSGLVVLCGPVNSGKTSTLYAALGELNAVERNLVTLEDPIERLLPGINQVELHEKAGLTFLSGLKAILRQDVTGILLGEIRDEETAAMAVRIALTGHLLMTTLHTEDTVSAIYRFLEMGVPAYLLAATLSGVVAQRLVRRICPGCRVWREVPCGSKEAALLQEAWHPGARLAEGQGCAACGGTGYQGRTVLSEVLLIDETLREGILQQWPRAKLKQRAIAQGMTSLWQDGCEKAMAGVTSLSEVRRVLYGDGGFVS
ncbi:GspE/PulE family protein [Mitsuokella jalaludinii]|uniref:GspE/PulE family protein n=1 Tax=Mitsuokella jalaludinii TaxID=187979 RepID=UPI0029E7204A|nr:GspE/PulE family protein [Selenomonadaceae bacterium]